MKHVVSISFDFEDERVRKILSETVEEHVKSSIKQDVIDGIFEKSSWGKDSHADPTHDPLKFWVREMVKEMLYENREDICRMAAKDIVESMNKSPKWKQKILEEVGKS